MTFVRHLRIVIPRPYNSRQAIVKCNKVMRSRAVRAMPGVMLVTTLFLSLVLRVWGSGYGLPAYTRYHPDEHALVERAAAILWTGDWNLHRFNYPPFFAYVQAWAYTAYFLWGASKGQWNQIVPWVLPQYYHVGRLVTAMAGTLTVLVAYLAARQLAGRRSGLLAAALQAGCYLHIIHSHYATFDAMVGLLALMALLFSLLMVDERQTRWSFLAGLAAGLAGATKYNGAVVFLVPLVAHVVGTRWGKWGWLNGRLLAVLAGFLMGFFGGNPYALGSMPEFLDGLATVLHHYGTEQPGFEGTGNWRWYPTVFMQSADAPWVLAGLAGLVGVWKRGWRRGLLVSVFPVVYYVMISRFVVRFERNMVPILPFLAVGGGWLLDSLAGQAARRLNWTGNRSHLLAGVALLAILALPVSAAIQFDVSIRATDLREVAGNWVEDNVEWGSKIAVEHYSIPFDPTEYWVKDVMRISDHDLQWYQQEEFDILIVSDGVWELLVKSRAQYEEKVAAYESLTAPETLLAEFVPSPPRLVVAGYPTVSIYHFAPVRIHRLPQ